MEFEEYNPVLNFLFFVSVIFFTIYISHPVFLAVSFIVGFVYSARLKNKNKKTVWFNLFLVLCAAVYAFIYASYNHFGSSVLGRNFIGNSMTAESLLYGCILGIKTVTVVMWLNAVTAVLTTDKIVYILGRVSPGLSIIVTILLRRIALMGVHFKRIAASRAAVGKGTGCGNVFIRVINFVWCVQALLTFETESIAESAFSMKSRGFTIRKRTAYSGYGFAGYDRGMLIFMVICMTVITMGMILDQTAVIYSPEIIINKATYASVLFYLAYFIYCGMPLFINIKNKYQNQI